MPFIPELLHFVSDVFVETGTFQGDTIHMVANNNIVKPSKIISFELSRVFFDRCRKRFENNPNVMIYGGNSKYQLYGIIKDIPEKITFWLDSHWSGTPNVVSDPVTICPVLEELDQIKKHSLNTHTIIIDDIRLMNNSNDKYIGFPVTKDQILQKLREINPNYIIKYFDDSDAANDVLVAYVPGRCIHKYLTKCATNPQPPGLADFLRGTIALYNFSVMYGYELLVDGEHPLFMFLKQNKRIIRSSDKVAEFLPPMSYNNIYNKLDAIFKSGRSFTAMTNSFYVHDGKITNFGPISENCQEYIKDILTPTDEVESKVAYVFREVYTIDTADRFKIIHLRLGDQYLHKNIYDEELYNLYYTKISALNKDEKYVLISDSSAIAKKLKANIPELLYWDNSKIHLGDLVNIQTSTILDTVVDFFIMSKSSEIITNGSGFSKVNSLLYNIKYTEF
jgi:hypothetical protein